MAITSRFCQSKQVGNKFVMVYEEFNPLRPSDSDAGIYVYTSTPEGVNLEDVEARKNTVKIPNTNHPVTNLGLQINDEIVAVAWSTKLNDRNGYRIGLSETKPNSNQFETCENPVDLPNAVSLDEIKIDILKKDSTNEILLYLSGRSKEEDKEDKFCHTCRH